MSAGVVNKDAIYMNGFKSIKYPKNSEMNLNLIII